MSRPFLATDIIAFDYETTGFPEDPEARVFAYCFTWCKDGYTEVYRDTNKMYNDRIQDFWFSPCTGVAHNLMFEWQFTIRHDWNVHANKVLHDTMILHQYFDNLSPKHSLDYAAIRYAGYVKEWAEADKAVAKAAKVYGSYDKIPEELMDIYQRIDGERTALLFEALWPEVRGSAMESEYRNEIELIKTTERMTRRGFMIHEPNCQRLIKDMEIKLEKAQDTADIVAGGSLNLNSPKQIAKYLFDDLQYPKIDDKLTVDKFAIEELRKIKDHPILDCILQARTYKVGCTTIRGYIDNARHDGAVHPNIRTNKARTGRESSDNPNLQNVAKEMKAGVKYTVAARSCFRARPGYYLLLADYAGIEMRLGVQGTNSKRLFQMCAEEFDFHSATAEAFYGTQFTEEKDPKVKSALRNRAKSARFAMFYGAGLRKTADTLGLDIEEARIGYERDQEVFPELYAFMAECAATAKRYGFIETFFGRRLRVASNESYAATDYKIQGSAAALFKHAQVAVDKYLFKHLGDDTARCILPVHDELVMELHRSTLPYLHELLPEINERMIDYPQITVPISVEYQKSMFTWDKKEKVPYVNKRTKSEEAF